MIKDNSFIKKDCEFRLFLGHLYVRFILNGTWTKCTRGSWRKSVSLIWFLLKTRLSRWRLLMTKSLTALVSGSEKAWPPWYVSKQGIGDAGRGSNMLTLKNFHKKLLSGSLRWIQFEIVNPKNCFLIHANNLVNPGLHFKLG